MYYKFQLKLFTVLCRSSVLFNYFLPRRVAGKDYETTHLHSYWRIEGNIDACGHFERNTSPGTAWHPATETTDLTHLDYHVRDVRGREGQGEGNIFLRTIIIQTRLIPRISYLPTRWIKSHYIAQEKSSPRYFFHFMAVAVSFSFSLSFLSRTFLAEVVFERTVASLRKRHVHVTCPHAICHRFPSLWVATAIVAY